MDFTFQVPPLFSPPPSQLSTSCLILIWRWRLNGGWFKSSSNSQARHKALQARGEGSARVRHAFGRLIKRWERSCGSPTRATSVLLQKELKCPWRQYSTRARRLSQEETCCTSPSEERLRPLCQIVGVGFALKNIFTFSVVARGVHVWAVDLDDVLLEFITLSR